MSVGIRQLSAVTCELRFIDAGGGIVASYPVPESWESKFTIPDFAVAPAVLLFKDSNGDIIGEKRREFSVCDSVLVIGPVVHAERLARTFGDNP